MVSLCLIWQGEIIISPCQIRHKLTIPVDCQDCVWSECFCSTSSRLPMVDLLIATGSASCPTAMIDSLPQPQPQPFYSPFSGTTQVSQCQKRTSGLLRCKERLTEADTQIIWLGATPSGLTSANLHHPPFFTGQMPFLLPNQQCQSTDRFKHNNYGSPVT